MAISGSLNFISASITGSSNINVDFVGLNTLIIDPVASSTNTLGQSTSLSSEAYYNSEVEAQSTSPEPNYFNSLLLHRNGPYQHPSWKQHRGGEHAVARSLRLNNTMSIDATYADAKSRETEKKQIRTTIQNSTHRELTDYFDLINVKLKSTDTFIKPLYQSPALTRYYEPSVLKSHKPFLYTIAPGLKVRSSLMNQMVFFENEGLNQSLNIAGPDRTTSSYGGSPVNRTKHRYYDLIAAAKESGGANFVYSQTIFPRAINAFRPYKLEKPDYEETSGIGSNGYDRALNRSFWRATQPALTSLASSDGTSRIRTDAAALNSQDTVQEMYLGKVLNVGLTSTAAALALEGSYDLLLGPSAPLPALQSLWNFTYHFIEPGIITYSAISTVTGTVGTDLGVDLLPLLQPLASFSALESYQPYPIALLSMWPLDPRPDIYNSPIYLTSSHGGLGLQIGLTPHRMKEYSLPAGNLEVTNSPIFSGSSLLSNVAAGGAGSTYSPQGPSGNTYSTHNKATASFFQATNMQTGSAGELAYSTKPTMFFHPTGSESRDIKGYASQTASLQYNRHTFPYNTPFYVTNKVRGRDPFYNSYEDFAQDIKNIGRDYSVIPEYTISNNITYYYEKYFKNRLKEALYFVEGSAGAHAEDEIDSFIDRSDDPLAARVYPVYKRKFKSLYTNKSFKLNFLTLDGASVTSSSGLESFSGSSPSSLVYDYSPLNKHVASTSGTTIKDLFNYKEDKSAIHYASDTGSVVFNETLAHTDTPEFFNLVGAPMNDGESTIPKRIKFTVNALKKLRPGKNFYPVTKTVDVGNKFKKFIYENIQDEESVMNSPVDSYRNPQPEQIQGRLQTFLEPFFAPGILYNSIKSGIAVDYPVFTSVPTYFAPWVYFSGSVSADNKLVTDHTQYGVANTNHRFTGSISSSFNYGGFYMLGASRCIPSVLNSRPGYRMPFEALYDTNHLTKFSGFGDKGPVLHLTTDFVDLDINYPSQGAATASALHHGGTAQEHPGSAYSRTCPRGSLAGFNNYTVNRALYESSINNFLCETMNFFLEDQGATGLKLPVIVSKPVVNTSIKLESDHLYNMEVSLEMGENQVMCEGPRRAGVGGGSFVNNLYANDRRHASMRGYIYGPPIEIVRMSGSVTVTDTQTFSNAGIISRTEPLIASDMTSDIRNTYPLRSGNGDYESYFAANLQDPAYEAFTPPYFYGKSSVILAANYLSTTATGIAADARNNIAQDATSIDTWDKMFEEVRKDSYYLEHYKTGSTSEALCRTMPGITSTSGHSSLRMKIESSVDVFKKARVRRERASVADEISTCWYIAPKWVCPVLDFSSSFAAVTSVSRGGLTQEDTSTVSYVTNSFHDITTGRGLWGGYGTDPYDLIKTNEVATLSTLSSIQFGNLDKGIKLKIKNIPNTNKLTTYETSYKTDIIANSGYYTEVLGTNSQNNTSSLGDVIGFPSSEESLDIGKIANSKDISEAVVVIPYFEKPVTIRGNSEVPSGEIFCTREIIPGKHFLPIHKMLFENLLSVAIVKQVLGTQVPLTNGAGTTAEGAGGNLAVTPGETGTTGLSQASYNDAITTDVYKMIETILGNEEKGVPGYELPPEFDFVNYNWKGISPSEKKEDHAIGPFQMIVVPVNHTLSKQELIDIYQGIMPESSLSIEKTTASKGLSLGNNQSRVWMPKTKGNPGPSLATMNAANFLDPSYLYAETLRTYTLDSDTESWIKTSRDFYKNLKFMTFKVKQKAVKDYSSYRKRQIKKAVFSRAVETITDLIEKRDITEEDLETKRTVADVFGYNWPYDDFSLIEAAKIDIEFEVTD